MTVPGKRPPGPSRISGFADQEETMSTETELEIYLPKLVKAASDLLDGLGDSERDQKKARSIRVLMRAIGTPPEQWSTAQLQRAKLSMISELLALVYGKK